MNQLVRQRPSLTGKYRSTNTAIGKSSTAEVRARAFLEQPPNQRARMIWRVRSSSEK